VQLRDRLRRIPFAPAHHDSFNSVDPLCAVNRPTFHTLYVISAVCWQSLRICSTLCVFWPLTDDINDYRIVLAPLYSYTGTSIVISEMQRLVDR